MRIYSNLDLNTFEAWSGAVSTLDRIREEGKTELLEAILEDTYPEGMSETELNDLLWFEGEAIFQWLGIPTEAELEEKAAKAAELLDAAGCAATFGAFCECFDRCENCPICDTPADSCEEAWKLWKEEFDHAGNQRNDDTGSAGANEASETAQERHR